MLWGVLMWIWHSDNRRLVWPVDAEYCCTERALERESSKESHFAYARELERAFWEQA